MVAPTDRRPLLTVDEVAEQLRLTPRQVRELVNRGRIPAIQISRKVLRFEQDRVLAALGSPAANGDTSHTTDTNSNEGC